MLRIGLTGGIGSGKSTVAELFGQRGVPIIDTDIIARQLTEPNQASYHEIIDIFGDTVLDKHGILDRARLRQQVFSNSVQRKQLESILHPRIRSAIEHHIEKLTAPYCIIVVPLLYETGFDDMVDRVLVVDTAEELQIKRVHERNGWPDAMIKAVLGAQLSRSERLARADDVISNSSDMESLAEQVELKHNQYLTQSL